MMPRPRKTRAFTLLEVLVATMLTAILASSLYVTLSIAFKARHSALNAVAPSRKVALTMELLMADLKSAVVPNGRLAGSFVGTDGQDSKGSDSDSVEFYCTTPSPAPAEGIGDIKKIDILCQPSDDGKTQDLVRQITTNLLSPVDVTPDTEVLCRGVYAFNLRYYDGTDWLDAYDSTTVNNLLPQAIEITLQLDDDKRPGAATGYRTTQVLRVPCSVPTSGSITVVSSGSSSRAGS
jgi:type II secretion system protein J